MKTGFLGPLTLSAIVLAMLALLAGCGDDSDDDDEQLSGVVRIDGSSTVYPITLEMAENFMDAEQNVDIEVGSSGTGRGFELFCQGHIEIADASRTILLEEIDECAANGIDDLVEVQVGVDALTVATHPSNEFANCLTTQQLFDIFTGAATRWNEVDPAFPPEAIVIYHPGIDSGSFNYFRERVIEHIDDSAVQLRNEETSGDETSLAERIAADESAIGYFGFANFAESHESLKAVEIDDGEGCVRPSIETAFDRSYYLSRPLFIYTREAHLNGGNDLVLAFVNFYMENTVGFVPSFRHISDSG
jgi:phosphate transport system substrate-binding protein